MPERTVVCNTSPLLYLYQVGQLGLLQSLYGQVVTPQAVQDAGSFQPGSLLILDDGLGRKIARLSHLSYTGALGVLVKSKQAGFIPRVSPVIEALRQTTMHLSPELISLVLKEAGE